MRHARTALLAVALAAVASAASCPGGSDAGSEPAPRAVLLVTVDGLVPSTLVPFGGDVATPSLGRVADGGRAFPDAWTADPMTRPAAATYLTGLAPDRHGVRDDLGTPLAGEVPTLATRLTAAGWHTAAFPDASCLRRGSGLLAGFTDVDAPPAAPVGPFGRVPIVRDADQTASDVAAWLETVPRGERWFAWVHFSQPRLDQLVEFEKHRRIERIRARREAAGEKLKAKAKAKAKAGGEPAPEEAGEESGDFEGRHKLTVAAFDAALGSILDAMAARGDLDAAAIAVAGTMGDVSGDGADRAPGSGFSVDAAAVEVPVVLRLPGGRAVADGPVWAPDVAATLASVTGIALDSRAEGRSLFEARPPDRIRIAWSWAPADQLGWPPLRVASDGTSTVGTAAGATAEIDAPGPLRDALAARAEPPAPRIALDEIRPLLAARGITPHPLPEGRSVSDVHGRAELVADLVFGRLLLRRGAGRMVPAVYESALARDPEAFSPLLEKGQVLFLTGRAEPAAETLQKLVTLYPTYPEAVHWYAHSIWADSWQQAEPLLLAVLPHSPEDSDLLYDLACTHSLGGDLDGSEQYLRKAIEAGFRNWHHMEADPDLRRLRESGRLGSVIEEYR